MRSVLKDKNYWILFVLLLGVFEPEVIRLGLMLPWLDSLFDIASLCVAILIAGAFLKRRIDLSPINIAFIFLAGILLISTVINGGNLSKYRYFWLSPIMSFFLISLSVRKDPYIASRAIADYLMSLLLINLVLAFLSPGGLFCDEKTGAVYYFLDHKNRIIFHYLAGFGAALVADSIDKSKRYFLLYSVVGLATFMIVDSTTSQVVLATMLILIVLASRTHLSPVLNIATLSCLVVGIFLVIVVFRGQMPLMSWFVEDVLGKSLTFTGRTEIWDSALSLIGSKPLLGHGIQLSDSTMIVARNRMWPHAHDVYLNILYQGGVVAFIGFIVAFGMCVKNLYIDRKGVLSTALSLVVFAYLLEFIFDVADYSGFFCILALAVNVERILQASAEQGKFDKNSALANS